jgi:hypothetical protein
MSWRASARHFPPAAPAPAPAPGTQPRPCGCVPGVDTATPGAHPPRRAELEGSPRARALASVCGPIRSLPSPTRRPHLVTAARGGGSDACARLVLDARHQHSSGHNCESFLVPWLLLQPDFVTLPAQNSRLVMPASRLPANALDSRRPELEIYRVCGSNPPGMSPFVPPKVGMPCPAAPERLPLFHPGNGVVPLTRPLPLPPGKLAGKRLEHSGGNKHWGGRKWNGNAQYESVLDHCFRYRKRTETSKKPQFQTNVLLVVYDRLV